MRLPWFIAIISCAYAYQISDPNCLRANPRVLDAEFSFLNRYEDRLRVTKEDVGKVAGMFTTRFKRAHVFSYFNPSWTEFIITGVSQNKNTKKNLQLFLRVSRDYKRGVVNRTLLVYQEYYDVVIKTVSLTQGPFVGLYLGFLGKDFSEQLGAVERVFGTKENSSIKIGIFLQDCFEEFKKTSGLKYYRRLDFILCTINPVEKPSPEDSANNVFKICGELRDIAISLNITAEIKCSVRYPSFGTSPEGIVGSVPDFQRFWCRIVEEQAREKSHPQIVMRSAVDAGASTNESTVMNGNYYNGWWRRRHATSYDANAFVEKVEELEGGREHRNCTAECSFCISSDECCEKRYCFPDTSGQPFEKPGRRRVCQSTTTKCAVRTPIISIARPTKEPGTASSASETGISPLTYFYIVTSILSIFLVVSILVVIFICRGSMHSALLTKPEIRHFFEGSSSDQIRPISGSLEGNLLVDDLPYDKNLELAKETFEIYNDQILGSGNFGVVFKGNVWGDDVAVKTTLPGVDKMHLRALLIELKILMHLGQNKNIVKIVGAHTPHLNLGKVHLFLELCPLGNLLEFLRLKRDDFNAEISANENPKCDETPRLTNKQLLQWSTQIANAIGHLESKKVIHADIAARNILVFSVDQVKLTDFGLSRRLYEYSNYVKKRQEPLPWRHMSVEALQDLKFSTHSDVWAFGVTLWEIFSLGRVPYSGYTWSMDFVELLHEGIRLQCPQQAHPLIYEVMTSCWIIDLKSRPPISVLEKKLTSALNELFTKRNYIQLTDSR